MRDESNTVAIPEDGVPPEKWLRMGPLAVAALRTEVLHLRAELEAARAVVEAARGSDIAEQHGEHCDAFRCTCGHTAVANALKAYDAAKAGKAVE